MHFACNPKNYQVPSPAGEDSSIHAGWVVCCHLLADCPTSSKQPIIYLFFFFISQKTQRSVPTFQRPSLASKRWWQPSTWRSACTSGIRSYRTCGAAWRTAAPLNWRTDTPSGSRTWWAQDRRWNTRGCCCGRRPQDDWKVTTTRTGAKVELGFGS